MKQIDYKLFFTVFALIIFWSITISSVSVYSSHNVTQSMVNKGLIPEAFNYFYVTKNIIHVIIWLIIMWIFTKIPYKFYEKNIKYIFWVAFFLLLAVFIPWIWVQIKWAVWWIDLKFLPFFIQPTEFMKIALIVFLAGFFKLYQKKLSDFRMWFLPFLGILLFSLFPIAMQPDFWTILVLFPVSVIMFFLAWANIKHLWITFLIWILTLFSVYNIWKYDKEKPEERNKLSYITDRLDIFLQDNKLLFWEWKISKKENNYQIKQALITIWSWWVGWVGFGNSIQKFWYLPEVQWDFIFSVIVEELGFMWAFILLNIFLYIWYRWFLIWFLSRDIFAKLTAYWITSWILLQAFINIWVNLNILPLTWITLPFISYWGSSLLALSIWIWILLNISRDIDFSESIFDSKYRKSVKKSRVRMRSL